jgi:N-acetylglucosaminyl-diphospho-decaprenol L-rhamnosyltransferase
MAIAQNSIIIVSHNKKASLRAMLEALELEHATTSEIIVVDNASFDDSADMVASEFPQVKLIRGQHNRGFAASAQRGINSASGTVAILCHGDLIAPIHTLAELADHLRVATQKGAGSRTVAAIPRVLGKDRVDQPTVGRLPGLGRGMIGVFNPSAARRLYVPYLDHVADHEWASFTCFAIDLEALGRIGMLDPRFFLYYADADLCHRIHDKGWRIAIRRDLSVVHTGASGNDPLPEHLKRIMRKDQQQYFTKHRSSWEQKLLNVDAKLYRFLSREAV